MPRLYFTPSSISYLTQFILSGIITVYLIQLLRRRENRSNQSILLVGFFVTITLFIGLFFLDVTLLPSPRLRVVYLENTVLGAALVLLIQFAYRYPTLYPSRKLESYVALGLSLTYTLYEANDAVNRFSILGQGIVNYRGPLSDYALAVVCVWVPVAFLRQAVKTDKRSVHWLRKLWQPQGLNARNARDFALVYLLIPALSVINIMRAFSIVFTPFYNVSMSMGILAELWLFTLVYLNTIPETTSFIVKLSGLTLTLLLAVIGTVGWVMSPAHIAAYQAGINDHQTLHFAPNAQGGYDITPILFHYESDLGDRLSLSSDDGNRNQVVDFPFPLYGHTYSEIYVTSDGVLCMGKKLSLSAMQNDYSEIAGIFPLLVDLEPAAGGGVYTHLEAERLIATWDHLPALQQPNAIYTFQAILYRDGSFDFTYNGLPTPLVFEPDANASATAWLRGVMPGTTEPVVQAVDLSQPIQSGPQGIVQDFYLDFRQYLNQYTLPLVWLVLAGSLIILIGLPLILQSNLVQPLKGLLAGVSLMDEGILDVQVQISQKDEFGLLAGCFNRMAAQMHAHVTGLETRVAERTQELEAVNAKLVAEMNERETTQALLLKQQRTLAVLEERERLGRELHDGIGQAMGYINVESQATHAFLADGQLPAAQASLRNISQLSRAAHNDIRNFILGLRTPSVSEDLFVTLEKYLRQYSVDFGIKATLSIPAEVKAPLFAPAVEEQILHILQEALTNIRKHASAQKVEVLVSIVDDQVQIIVSDDGVGFDTGQPIENSQHFGLNMMQERAVMVGGNVELRSSPGSGTKVLVIIPRHVSVTSNLSDCDMAAARELRILLVDDSPLFLDGFRNLLMARGLMVVGMAHDGLAAQEKARVLRPDVIVMDIQMPRCNGLEATRAIKAELPEVKIIVLTQSEDEENLFEAIKSGASGYLLKSLDADDFCKLLAGLADGEVILTPKLASRVLADLSRSNNQFKDGTDDQGNRELTPRQWEILELVSEGMMYKEIAAVLHLGEQTIKYHMGKILERLQLETRREAIAYANRVRSQGK